MKYRREKVYYNFVKDMIFTIRKYDKDTSYVNAIQERFFHKDRKVPNEIIKLTQSVLIGYL